MRRALALVVTTVAAATASPARADHEFPTSTLIGPLLGVAWGGEDNRKADLTAGLEGGFGLHELLTFNVGSTWRGGELFSYAELDGWFFLGGTFGFGHGTRDGWQPVLGVWEVLPPKELDGTCEDAEVIVFSAGYRYTGMHELYVTGKYGEAWLPCF